MSEFPQTNSCLQLDYNNAPLIDASDEWFAKEFVDYEPHLCTNLFKNKDRLSFVSEYVLLPPVITINLKAAFIELCDDKIINNYISEMMIIECLNVTVACLSEGIDFLDISECSLDEILEEFLTNAAENGNLPPDEEAVCVALRDKLCKFGMDSRRAMLAIDLPIIEYIGLPYDAISINVNGIAAFKLRNVQDISSLLYD